MSVQQRDTITYHKKKYALNRDIMKAYFQVHQDKKPEKIGFDSNLLRGYYSEFKVFDQTLFVVDLRVYVGFDGATGKSLSQSVMTSVLSDRRKCKWFTGPLLLDPLSAKTDNKDTWLCIQVFEGMVKEVETLHREEFAERGGYESDYY